MLKNQNQIILYSDINTDRFIFIDLINSEIEVRKGEVPSNFEIINKKSYYGVFGFITLDDIKILILIKETHPPILINGKKIYQISLLKFLPLKNRYSLDMS